MSDTPKTPEELLEDLLAVADDPTERTTILRTPSHLETQILVDTIKMLQIYISDDDLVEMAEDYQTIEVNKANLVLKNITGEEDLIYSYDD